MARGLVRRDAEEDAVASGGARNRSGPAKDPGSARSERLGASVVVLPAEGFRGRVPRWPLPKRVVYAGDYSVDERGTADVEARERALWRWAWRTPQAVAWAMQSEAWRLHSIAMWVRTAVVCESSAATAADKNSLHRFADQVGLTPAGLRENGWRVAPDELAGRRGRVEQDDEVVVVTPPVRRMRAAPA